MNDKFSSKALMDKYDPNKIFINNFGRRMTKSGTKIDLDPLTTRCALLDNCICSKNSDCAKKQTCTTIPGYDYKVCKTNNETPEQVFDRSLFPPPTGLLNWLLTVVPTLSIAALAKCPVLDFVIDTIPDLLGSVLG